MQSSLPWDCRGVRSMMSMILLSATLELWKLLKWPEMPLKLRFDMYTQKNMEMTSPTS